MRNWSFYPAFIGTAISVASWTYFALRNHASHIPRTLSELAVDNPESLRYYRIVLWVCGPQFLITILFYIIPRIAHVYPVAFACVTTACLELLVGVFPAKGKTVRIHNVISFTMGLGMIVSAFLFAWSLGGMFRNVLFGIGVVMTGLGLLATVDRKHFLFYELPFLYLAHISILITATALK